MPAILQPLSCFSYFLWFYIILTGIVSTIVWFIIKNINHKLNNKTIKAQNNIDKIIHFTDVANNTAMLFLSAPMKFLPYTTSERFFVSSICLMSLIITAIFQSNLATVSIKPNYYRDILSLSELSKSNLLIGIKFKPILDDIFPANTSKNFEKLRKKLYQWNQKNVSVMKTMSAKRSFASATRKTSLKLDNAIYITSKKLFMVPECPKTYNLAYALKKDSIFLEPINHVLNHLLNGGFIEKWINDMEYNQTFINVKQFGVFEDPQFKILTLEDVHLPAFTLLLGVFLSVIVLLCEILWFKLHRPGEAKTLNGSKHE